MKLTFWGAAGAVTGSMHLVESNGKRILLDCGLNQGRRKDADAKNRNLPFPGSSIDAVILSHAHIDHSGNLPTLVKSGFAGPIYTTPATVDLCNWMLRDTAHIHEKDAEFLNKRLEKRKSRLLLFFNLMAVLSTFMLAWVIYTQVVVLRHHWALLRKKQPD